MEKLESDASLRLLMKKFFLDITERSSSLLMKKMSREPHKDFGCPVLFYTFTQAGRWRRMHCTPAPLFLKESADAGMLLAIALPIRKCQF